MTEGLRLAASPDGWLRHVRVPVRLALALAVLALPLAGAIWSVGNFVASEERQRADARLEAALRAAAAAYLAEGNSYAHEARRLALSGPVRRALVARDRAALARVAARTGNAAFALGADPVRRREPALVRTARVIADGRIVGAVGVFAPFDRRLAARMHRRAGLRARVTLAFADDRGRVTAGGLQGTLPTAPSRAFDARLGGTPYRAVSTRLAPGEPRLVALMPQATIAAAERRGRHMVLVAGLVTLVSVIVIAYLLAPVIARARLGKRERDQAARVLERVGDGICALDGDGVVRFWNPAAEAITGLSASAVRGRLARTAVPGWAKLDELVPVSDSPAGRPSAVTVPLDVDGRELWLSVSAVRSTDGAVYAFRDLTEERRFESMRSDLVATVSHELRTPLASIQGAAFTLRGRDRELDADTRDELLAMIDDQSSRLARLADEILLTTRLGAGHVELRRERLQPEAIARDVVDAGQLQAGPRLAVALRLHGRVPTVVADGDKLRQVLANLLDNAIKYSPAGGRIEVAVAGSNGHVRFAVRDEGIGIPSGEQERIFEKFYRLDPQLSRGVGGSGLGLYISRELLRHMGGRIWVEPQRPRGSTFYVELPSS